MPFILTPARVVPANVRYTVIEAYAFHFDNNDASADDYDEYRHGVFVFDNTQIAPGETWTATNDTNGANIHIDVTFSGGVRVRSATDDPTEVALLSGTTTADDLSNIVWTERVGYPINSLQVAEYDIETNSGGRPSVVWMKIKFYEE